ncbi:MAG: zinc ribbon domain-containing protein [Desulfosporosinus sp.]
MKYKRCQSCGMPFSNDGSEETINQIYCGHCYQNGVFTLPNITANEMKQLMKNKIIEFGFPRFLAALYTRNIHKLERWKKT